jgi:hypothetical protein
MTRPLYENSSNLENERQVALFLEDSWMCKTVKLPIKYGLDYSFQRNNALFGFCEIKCLNYKLDQLNSMSGGYFISLGKFMSAKNLVEFTNLPFFLVLDLPDGIWFRKFTEFTNLKFVVNGRKDRNDWQDIEPMVLLETHTFKKILDKQNKHWLDD